MAQLSDPMREAALDKRRVETFIHESRMPFTPPLEGHREEDYNGSSSRSMTRSAA